MLQPSQYTPSTRRPVVYRHASPIHGAALAGLVTLSIVALVILMCECSWLSLLVTPH